MRDELAALASPEAEGTFPAEIPAPRLLIRLHLANARLFRSALDALKVVESLKTRGVKLHLLDLGGDIAGNGPVKAVSDDRRRLRRGRAGSHPRALRLSLSLS